MNDHTVLFVDDEPGVLRAMKRLFRRTDIRVLTAGSGPDGLALLAEQPVDVVVSDQRMPGMCGTDFLKEVRGRYPDTVRCILSGYAEMHAVVAAINDGNVYRFMSKPWDDEQLVEVIRECLTQADSIDAERRAQSVLEQESAQYAELVQLQETLLRASKDVLEHLPIAVAAVDSRGRMIYANGLFSSEFGHLPGATLGQAAGEPWRTVASAAADDRSRVPVVVGDAHRTVHINTVDIGGQAHTLIALPMADDS